MRASRTLRHSRSLAVVSGLIMCASAAGQAQQHSDDALDSVTNAPPAEHYWVRVTGERVNIRSRADVNSRIVGRVDSGDLLEAVRSEYGWHRVIPPAGVYSVVAAEYVNLLGDSRGVVGVDTSLRVRVGSDIQSRDPELSEVQTRLQTGAEVKILGRLGERWLKIAPPPGVHVYVWGDLTERISEAKAARLGVAKRVTEPVAAPEVVVSKPAAESPAPVEEVEVRDPGLATSDSPDWEPPPTFWETTVGAAEQPAATKPVTTSPAPADVAVNKPAPATPRTEPVVEARPVKSIPPAVETKRAAPALSPRRFAPPRDFDARGTLTPSYAIRPGEFGLRYVVSNPVTHKREAFVEIPQKLHFNAPANVGKYVGVHGDWLTDEAAGVKVLRATRVTVLNVSRR